MTIYLLWSDWMRFELGSKGMILKSLLDSATSDPLINLEDVFAGK